MKNLNKIMTENLSKTIKEITEESSPNFELKGKLSKKNDKKTMKAIGIDRITDFAKDIEELKSKFLTSEQIATLFGIPEQCIIDQICCGRLVGIELVITRRNRKYFVHIRTLEEYVRKGKSSTRYIRA